MKGIKRQLKYKDKMQELHYENVCLYVIKREIIKKIVFDSPACRGLQAL